MKQVLVSGNHDMYFLLLIGAKNVEVELNMLH